MKTATTEAHPWGKSGERAQEAFRLSLTLSHSGGREYRAAALASDMYLAANEVDELADLVGVWAENPTARGALPLIARGDRAHTKYVRFHTHDLIGRNTSASLWQNDPAIAYRLMHALGEIERERDGTLNEGGGARMAQSGARVTAANLRVNASTLRVVAGMVLEIAKGERHYIR